MAAPKTATKSEDNEHPTDRFKRLATARMNKALSGVGGIAQLANQNRYEYTDAQIDTIEEALTSEVQACISALRARKVPTGARFTL